MNIQEVQAFMETLVHSRFSTKELKEKIWKGFEICWNDIDAVNIEDYNIMFDYRWFDVDLYFLYDRYWKMYITEIAVNNQ